MLITFPDTKEIIDAIRGAIGRDVIFNVDTMVSGCPLCNYDPINNMSFDLDCPVCSGAYWLRWSEDISVSGHIRWGPAYDALEQPGGRIFDGDCVVTIEYSPENEYLASGCNYLLVDNRKMKVKRYTLRGHKKVNRIRLELEYGN